jgi:hypothetical protein
MVALSLERERETQRERERARGVREAHTCGAEEQARAGRLLAVQPHRVAHGASNLLASLRRHTAGQPDRRDTPRLGADDAAGCAAACSNGFLQNELGHLQAATCSKGPKDAAGEEKEGRAGAEQHLVQR